LSLRKIKDCTNFATFGMIAITSHKSLYRCS
jgi:hypothetical protein